MKEIPGFPGYYATRDGRILSSHTHHPAGDDVDDSVHELRPKTMRYGHKQVTLRKDRISHFRNVHQLVLETFAGPRPPGKIACHGPNGTADNSLSNLSWQTYKQNTLDRLRDGTDNRGTKHSLAKLSVSDVREIRRLYQRGGISQQKIADRFKIDQTHVSEIVRRKEWTCVD